MKKLLLIFLLIYSVRCSNTSNTDHVQRIETLERELASKNEKIHNLENLLSLKNSKSKPEYWYAFQSTTEHNVVKLGNDNSKEIDAINLKDSVDKVYLFNHKATIVQINDDRTISFLQNYRQHEETYHESGKYCLFG